MPSRIVQVDSHEGVDVIEFSNKHQSVPVGIRRLIIVSSYHLFDSEARVFETCPTMAKQYICSSDPVGQQVNVSGVGFQNREDLLYLV
tara:strand:- start:823 stop:1086 length:264 start_codon:yes stop_codon:yes gene_type:complete